MTTNMGTGTEDLQALVKRVVREELVQARLAAGSQDVGQVVAPLGPILERSILDALALGAQLAAGDVPVPAAPSASAAAAPAAALAPYIPPPVAVPEAPAPAVRSLGAAVLEGSMTLVVAPFAGYVEVQRFLKELERSPLVHDVKPKRFAAGRLFVLVQTEAADGRVLAEGLVQELRPMRLAVRSVQQDLVELVFEGPAEGAA